MKPDIKQISAIAFQFSLLAILTVCLFYKVGDPDTIIGAIIGLCVGIGIATVSE